MDIKKRMCVYKKWVRRVGGINASSPGQFVEWTLNVADVA